MNNLSAAVIVENSSGISSGGKDTLKTEKKNDEISCNKNI